MPDVAGHYAKPGLVDRFLSAIGQPLLGPLTLADLGQFDELHLRGERATQELIALGRFARGQRVLDLGSGLGGAARKIAASADCVVTGIDLTAEFVRVATALSERAGFAGRTQFVIGDATSLPFGQGSFDRVVSLHTTMNIADKAALVSEIRRVLKPEGLYVFYEVFAGRSEVALPVPWAESPSLNHLQDVGDARKTLESQGMVVTHWQDTSIECRAWLENVLPKVEAGAAPHLEVVLGSNRLAKLTNVWEGLRRESLKVVLGVAEPRSHV